MVFFDSLRRWKQPFAVMLILLSAILPAQVLMAQNTHDLDDLDEGQVLTTISLNLP